MDKIECIQDGDGVYSVGRLSATDVDIVYCVTFVPGADCFIGAHVWHGSESDVLSNQAEEARFDCWSLQMVHSV